MIIPAVSPDDRYSDGDPYTDDGQYRDTGPATVSYGSDYGTGTYSDYTTGRGRYTVTVEVDRYSSESGYTNSTESTGEYGTMSTDSYRYGDGQDTMIGAGSLDYVIDVLDGDVDTASGDQIWYA